MTTIYDRDRFEISASQRRAIAPHRGDVTTVRAAERLRARATEASIGRQRQGFEAGGWPRERGDAAF